MRPSIFAESRNKCSWILLAFFLLLVFNINPAAFSMSNAKRILVTGANKGIGKAICKKLLTDYPDCHVLLGSRDIARGEAAIADIIGSVGDDCQSRIELVPIDVSDDASVAAAAAQVSEKFSGSPTPLYGVVNNAGIGFGYSVEETLNVNFFGTRRVCDNFLPLITKGGSGRIVNIASASGPMYVAKRGTQDKALFTNPDATLEQLDQRAATAAGEDADAYGLSKAFVNVYTMLMAKANPDLRINSCTPGFIATDITAGMGATNPPEKGTIAPLFCLFDDSAGTGKYYGSDAVRSPLDRYRGPGDPPYEP